MTETTEPATDEPEVDDGLIEVPYTGGVTLSVELPSGWQTITPGDVARCTDEDVEALRPHPDFETPPPVDLVALLAGMTGDQLNEVIDTHELDVAKSLLVDERRSAIATELANKEG